MSLMASPLNNQFCFSKTEKNFQKYDKLNATSFDFNLKKSQFRQLTTIPR